MSDQTIIRTPDSPGCLIQLLWFAFVGWWLTGIWISAAWLLMLTIIGIPFGVMMINKVPTVLALRGQSIDLTVIYDDGQATVKSGGSQEHNILLRAIYFVLIGWWLSGIWMQIAYFFCLSIVGLPIGFWMFDKTPALLSLKK
ncbi:MAG: hypothetical protein B6244_01735 [Candidatus Cloacimonetes bacterium 4572_55]|nr:MAG: hypothetical protein B6244_01735 [Candidatus Cloacimonetes bacterium 4572_55]